MKCQQNLVSPPNRNVGKLHISVILSSPPSTAPVHPAPAEDSFPFPLVIAGIFTLSPTLSHQGRGDYRCHCEERRRRGNLDEVEHTPANRRCCANGIATSFDELRMSGRSSQWRLAGIFTLSPTLSRRGRGDYRCHYEERQRRGNLVAVEHTSANRRCCAHGIATSFDELRMSGRSSQ